MWKDKPVSRQQEDLRTSLLEKNSRQEFKQLVTSSTVKSRESIHTSLLTWTQLAFFSFKQFMMPPPSGWMFPSQLIIKMLPHRRAHRLTSYRESFSKTPAWVVLACGELTTWTTQYWGQLEVGSLLQGDHVAELSYVVTGTLDLGCVDRQSTL